MPGPPRPQGPEGARHRRQPGIGKAVAIALGQAGADVVVNYVAGPEQAELVADEIRREGVRAIAHQADVSQEEQVQAMFARMAQELGGVDILVANAGLQKDAPLEEMTLKDWNTVIGVNLTGQSPVRPRGRARLQAPGCPPRHLLRRRQDRLHELGPRHHPLGRARELCRQQGRDAADEEHRAGGAPAHPGERDRPGAITPINRAAWETPEAYADLMRLIPYKRIGEPEDIARAAVWLASDEADYLTGTTLYVDGGMTLYPGFEAGVRQYGNGGAHGDTGPALGPNI